MARKPKTSKHVKDLSNEDVVRILLRTFPDRNPVRLTPEVIRWNLRRYGFVP